MTETKHNHLSNQKGSALAVSLVILLVMTILGVNSMSSIVLEERMAGHLRQSMVASQATQAALRVAETWINNNVDSINDLTQFRNATQGLYSPHTGSPLLTTPFDVADDAGWTNAANNSIAVNLQAIDLGNVKGAGDLVGRNPRYIIEYLGQTGSSPTFDPTQPPINPAPHAFRITAIGWGEDTTARFLAQSTFQKAL